MIMEVPPARISLMVKRSGPRMGCSAPIDIVRKAALMPLLSFTIPSSIRLSIIVDYYDLLGKPKFLPAPEVRSERAAEQPLSPAARRDRSKPVRLTRIEQLAVGAHPHRMVLFRTVRRQRAVGHQMK